MKKIAVRNLRLCTKDCLCLYVCPVGATDTENSIIDVTKCTGCGICAEACPSKAISMVPLSYPSQQKKAEKVVATANILAQAKAQDRGTQRICVWGEKVTRMVQSLLARYEKEGEAFLEENDVWVCTVCGFIYVGKSAPALCPVCKVPDWKFEKIERRA